MEEAVEGNEGGCDDARPRVRCLKCTKKGHLAAKCSVELYYVICNSTKHVNHRCPVLKQPRPIAHVVGYAVHGLGLYHIPHPPLPRVRKVSKMTLITTVGGQLTKDQVQTQLQRIFPSKWEWELTDHEDKAMAFGGADVKEQGIPPDVRLQFDVWHEKEEGFLLPKNNLGRVFVTVLNPTLIYPHLDVVIGDHYFELEFEVERIGVDENGEEIVIEWSGDADGEGEEEGDGEDHSPEDPEMSRETKGRKSSEGLNERKGGDNGGKHTGHAKHDGAGLDSLREKVQKMNKQEFMSFLKEKIEVILDISVHKTLEELAEKEEEMEGTEDSL
uniref:CCHC-type domain-containing protein n=1 Tax=Setaria viridis TaxID=4556 RepID=A0A4U6WF54_SETVI|nr:hypothetical protein SEVIR_2G441200v2 [Setaria viridis]